MKVNKINNKIIKVLLEPSDKTDAEDILDAEDIETLLVGKGYKIKEISNGQVMAANAFKEIEIELEIEEVAEEVGELEEEPAEDGNSKKPFDGKGIYGENISSRFEFLNKGSEKVWEVLSDYLDRGYMITNLVVARGWSSYRCDFSFRNGQVYRDVYKVRGEEITLLREIANDSFPDKSGCDGRRVLKKSINKLDDGALGIKLLVHEEKGPIELKIVMDKIY